MSARSVQHSEEMPLSINKAVKDQPDVDKLSRQRSGGMLTDKIAGYHLLEWDEICHWQQDNEYILSGYRPTSDSLLKSLGSLGHVHNETSKTYLSEQSSHN
ncbi:hypothetical protein SBOR_3493 [Sclerotinia borealis F-4128]|uniref:Uncharacterized protein n=1 Tax=Sclerotinia borealis (strain F-4128) TaxID=1432307 RepID=W9CN74_SCLBF|nr:hypothetical protein SBOR_3493 [Sclerotinia borealis F-4128]